MTTTRVGALPVTTFAADTVVRVAADADLWESTDSSVIEGRGDLPQVGVVSARDLLGAYVATDSVDP